MLPFYSSGRVNDISVKQTVSDIKLQSFSGDQTETAKTTIDTSINIDTPESETVDLGSMTETATTEITDIANNTAETVNVDDPNLNNKSVANHIDVKNNPQVGNIDPGDMQTTKRDLVGVNNPVNNSNGNVNSGNMQTASNNEVNVNSSRGSNPSGNNLNQGKGTEISVNDKTAAKAENISLKNNNSRMTTGSDKDNSIAGTINTPRSQAKTDTGKKGTGDINATMSGGNSTSSMKDTSGKIASAAASATDEVRETGELAYEQSTLRMSEEEVDEPVILTPEEYVEVLKGYGLIDEDIERVMNGEITLDELMCEIDSDSERKRLVLEAVSLHDAGLEYTSLDELAEEIKVLDDELQERADVANNKPNAFLHVIAEVRNGRNLDDAAKNTIAGWEYTDEKGNKTFVTENPCQDGKDPRAKQYIPITVYEKYKDTKEYQEIEKSLTEKETQKLFGDGKVKTYKYDRSAEQDSKLKELEEKYSKGAAERAEKLAELDAKIQEVSSKKNTAQYIHDQIKGEIDNYLNNVDGYIKQDDFEKNNIFNPEWQKKVDDLLKDNSYATKNAAVSIDGDDEAAVLATIINGGRVSDGFVNFTSKDGLIEFIQKASPYMSDQEKEVFNYIYNSKGADAALKYLQEISPTLDARWVAGQTQKDQEFANEHPIIASVGSVFVTPVEGISAACYSMNSLMNGQKIKRADVYSSGDVWRSTVSGSIAEYDEANGTHWAFVYDTGMSMADSAVLIGVGALTGGAGVPILSAALMGSRAYVSTLNQALDKGMSDGAAVALAWSSAVVETLMESYSVGHLLNLEGHLGVVTKNLVEKFAGPDSVFAKKALYYFAGAISQGLAEGEEEFGTEILNYVFDEMIAGDLSDHSQTVATYISQGYSERDAELLALKDLGSRAMMAFTGGFVSGLCFGSFGSVKTTHKVSYAIANNMYGELEGGKGDKFAKALNINIEQMEAYEQALKDQKAGKELTDVQKDLLNNGTVEMQVNEAIKQARRNKYQEVRDRIRAQFGTTSNDNFSSAKALNQIKMNDSSINTEHIPLELAPKVLELQKIAMSEGMTLKEYGNQKSDISVSPETQAAADALATQKRTLAEAAEPQITADMKALEVNGRKLVGLDKNLKSIDSTSRKILLDSNKTGITLEAAYERVSDSVRYTMICNEETFTDDIRTSLQTLLDKGYKLKGFRNSFASPLYRGVNTNVISPDGTVVEIQFHTEQSYDAKENKGHLFYEISRNEFTSPEAKEISNEIRRGITSQVDQPNGILELTEDSIKDLNKIVNLFELDYRDNKDKNIADSLMNVKNNISNINNQDIKFILGNICDILNKKGIKVGCWSDGTKFWGQMKTIGMNNLLAEDYNKCFMNLFHEGGHALYHIVDGEGFLLSVSLSEEETAIMKNARENYELTDERKEILKNSLKRRKEAQAKTDEWYESRRDAENQRIRNYIENQFANNSVDDLKNQLNKYFSNYTMIKNIFSEYSLDINDFDSIISNKELFIDIMQKGNHIENKLHHDELLESDYSQYGVDRKISSMLNSLLMDVSPIDLGDGELYEFSYGHDNAYFADKGEVSSFDELVADYLSIHASGNQKIINTIETILGKDVTDLLDAKYKHIADNLRENMKMNSATSEVDTQNVLIDSDSDVQLTDKGIRKFLRSFEKSNDSQSSKIDPSSYFHVPEDISKPVSKDPSSYFHVPKDISKSVVNMSSYDELIKKLVNENLQDNNMNEKRDKEFIKFSLNELKLGNGIDPMYNYIPDGMFEGDSYKEIVSKTTFDDGGSGFIISGNPEELLPSDWYTYRGGYDYRVTFRNSSNIHAEDAVNFINTLVSEANKRGLNLRAKNYWETDAFILYLQHNDLVETVKMLEDFKDATKYGESVARMTKSFGETVPFSATIGEDGYYGISMYSSEEEYGKKSAIISKSYGKTGSTFNGYVGQIVKDAYNQLVQKYNGDVDKITVDELYDKVYEQHEKYMLGTEANKELPLWMNRRNYQETIELNKENTAKQKKDVSEYWHIVK